MYLIGESIHIISPRVKEALAARDGAFFVQLARRQVQHGANALDLNIGPQKKAGVEIMEWLVDCVQEGVGDDVVLSFDTTNLDAIEAGLKRVKRGKAIVNSTSAEEERLMKVPELAARYGAKLIALTMEKEGIPVSAEARVTIALEKLLPRMEEVGIPISDVIIDPLVLTVSGCQEYVPQFIEAVRILKTALDPAPMVNAGLSNVSNQVPAHMRSLIDRVYAVMLSAVGLDCAIANVFDRDLLEFIRVVETRNDESPRNRLLLALYDAIAAGETLSPDVVDMSDPEQVAIYKTVQILLNQVIYADGYLAT